MKMSKVFVVFVLAALFGVSCALDLSGCQGYPKIINALSSFNNDIYSPGYREGVFYPDDLFCQYTLQAPFGFKIRLTFVDLEIEVFDLCEKDQLIVFDGISPNAPAHGVFCGNRTYPDLVSVGNALHILFRSDFMIRKKGFHLKYSASVNHDLCGNRQKLCRNRNCFNVTQSCDGVDNCGDGTDEENCGYPVPQSTCGLRPKTLFNDEADRIVGGREAAPYSWPWQADLQLGVYHPNGHMCGGTLINAQWIVSAAHCFMRNTNPGEWRVHLGNHRKFHKDAYEQVRLVERIIIYPNITGDKLFPFEMESLDNDMALMKLNAPVKLTDQVRPACLPTQGYSLQTNTKCMATGWGNTRGSGSFHVLKEVDMWIEAHKTCDGDMGSINNRTTICVSNRNGYQDVCHGDSGGPLVCEYNGAWHVMGATSHGTAGNYIGGLCALPGSYTVYARVADKTSWIQSMISKYS